MKHDNRIFYYLANPQVLEFRKVKKQSKKRKLGGDESSMSSESSVAKKAGRKRVARTTMSQDTRFA